MKLISLAREQLSQYKNPTVYNSAGNVTCLVQHKGFVF